MRSSIACSRCRRSKIKCVNAGIDTTCRACESSGRECSYPTPAAAGGCHSSAGVKRDITASSGIDDTTSSSSHNHHNHNHSNSNTNNNNSNNNHSNGEWDNPKRQRHRKHVNTSVSSKDAMLKQNYMLVLDSAILTPKVWETLFDLFQQHFATVLPFLHPTTSLAQIRHGGHGGASSAAATTTDGQHATDLSQSPAPRTEVSPLILLGVLTLTARFHPQLAQHHSPASPVSPCNPTAASEFYASVLRARLAGTDGADITITDLSRVQALLMLALHEWGMCRGKNAWIYLGMAVRMSQTMGLSFEPTEDDSPYPSSMPISTSTPSYQYSSRRPSMHTELDQQSQHREQLNSDDVIEQETRRRTFWSCFILDRCLSNGRLRPRMLRVREIGIQLPSENAFAFGERVRTSLLSDGNTGRNGPSRRSQSYDSRNGSTTTTTNGVQIPSLRQSIGYADDVKSKPWPPISSHRSDGMGDRIDRWEVGVEECVLGRLVRIIRIWGSVAKWACEGGRRSDQCPPWHHESRFNQLRDQLHEFQEGLYRNLQYSARNTDTHIMYKNSLAPYALMHIIYFLSVIVLHRAYLPFLPLRPMDPQGPLDEPSYPPERYSVPDGFWKHSARELFRAARQMVELVRTCHERGVLMETPLVGFAIYNAAFMGVYAAHFNHMDQDGYMCLKPQSTDGGVAGSPGRTAVTMMGAGSLAQADVRKSIEILGEMRPRLKMAVGWFRTVHRLHGYFCKAKRDQRRPWREMNGVDGQQQQTSPYGNGSRVIGGAQQQHGSHNHNHNHNRHASASQIVQNNLYEELRQLDKVLTELGNTEDQTPEMSGSEDDMAAMLAANPVEHSSETPSNVVKSEPGEGPDTAAAGPHASDGHAGSLQRDSWVPVNSSGSPASHSLGPVSNPTTTTTPGGAASTMVMMANGCRENGEKQPSDCDRWPILPAPQHQAGPSSGSPYSLPPFQGTYRDTASSGHPTSPPSSAGTTLPPPVPSASAVTAPTTAASSPYFPATPSPSNSNSNHRLQAVQPWPTSRQPPPPPPPPYTQSLPSLNLAAQQNFPLPPLQPSLTHGGQALGGHGHGHGPGSGPAQHSHTAAPGSSNRTPPLSQSRLDLGSFLAPPLTQQQQQQQQPHHQHQQQYQQQQSSRHVSPYNSYDAMNTNPLWMSSLNGEDVLAFIEADSLDKWSTVVPTPNGPPSPASLSNMNGQYQTAGNGYSTAANTSTNANGWLGLIWSEYTH
ncbi:hypothetical protein MGYG_03194 [Nannizzia gypsea CBS 118893]|uniref:Zn(2)-C6 fungal-type domain-containing protein n=1 Tax=Arthroderma gypseum (strain ATCC MYA-4604 / CBS 118893) TaxID=535722 RepID=E4URC7_ARTGP|nr:hypothetical protein MGYG_03194 [Nannizzia gypsea CBS 118893]EFR00190.1 hypothetical protein MGYG_03194 [Nannizzia gypsea CBS 118893]